MTSTTENKELVKEFFSRLNEQDLGVVDDVCADGFAVVINRKGSDESAIGPDGLKALYEEYFAAFPDFQHDIDELVAEGDLVGVFMTSTGSPRGYVDVSMWL